MKIEVGDIVFVSTDSGIDVVQEDIVLFRTTPDELMDIAKMMRKEKNKINLLNGM